MLGQWGEEEQVEIGLASVAAVNGDKSCQFLRSFFSLSLLSLINALLPLCFSLVWRLIAVLCSPFHSHCPDSSTILGSYCVSSFNSNCFLPIVSIFLGMTRQSRGLTSPQTERGVRATLSSSQTAPKFTLTDPILPKRPKKGSNLFCRT